MFRIIIIGAAALGVSVGPVLPGLAGEPRVDEPIVPIPQTVTVDKNKAELGKNSSMTSVCRRTVRSLVHLATCCATVVMTGAKSQ